MLTKSRETAAPTARTALLAWKPTPTALAPVAVMAAASLLIFSARRLLPSAGLAGVIVWIVDLAYILLPLYFVVRKGGAGKASLGSLGLTSQGLAPAALAGLALGLFLATAQVQQLSAAGKHIGLVFSVAWVAWVVSLVYHVFAEEMLYRAWFQKAFLPAFGIVPGIALAAVLYALAPLALLGSDPSFPAEWQTPAGFLAKGFPMLAAMGLVLNMLYLAMRNIVASTVASATILFPLGLVVDANPPSINPWLALALILALVFVAVQVYRKYLGIESR